QAPVVQAIDGNLYGTTYQGGTANFGTVFRLTPGGVFTQLHSFQGGDNDGANPTSPLLFTSDLKFISTTQFGPTTPVFNGPGTIFTMDLAGTVNARPRHGGVRRRESAERRRARRRRQLLRCRAGRRHR